MCLIGEKFLHWHSCWSCFPARHLSLYHKDCRDLSTSFFRNHQSLLVRIPGQSRVASRSAKPSLPMAGQWGKIWPTAVVSNWTAVSAWKVRIGSFPCCILLSLGIIRQWSVLTVETFFHGKERPFARFCDNDSICAYWRLLRSSGTVFCCCISAGACIVTTYFFTVVVIIRLFSRADRRWCVTGAAGEKRTSHLSEVQVYFCGFPWYLWFLLQLSELSNLVKQSLMQIEDSRLETLFSQCSNLAEALSRFGANMSPVFLDIFVTHVADIFRRSLQDATEA